MENLINSINNIIWSPALIMLCLGAGIYFSFRLRFCQVFDLKEMGVLLLQGEKSDAGISSFQGFATALAGRIGTGNIAGVAVAVTMGGPGALVWMCVVAFFGASTAFIESALGQIYKDKHKGEYRGGPAYYFEKGLGWKWYGVAFATITAIGMAIFMPGTQSNTIYMAMNQAFGLSPMVVAIALTIILALVVFGGIKRIGATAEKIIPIMGGIYVLMALAIILTNLSAVPSALSLMFTSAFGSHAMFGGIVGQAISWGVKRGVYSNEAGQGTGPHAASASEVSHPAKQGLVQAFSVYVDTLFVCMATGLMLIITGQFNVGGIFEALPGVEAGPQYAQAAVNTLVPGFGEIFIAIALFFFAFTTLIAFSYMMETNISYLATRLGFEKQEKMVINAGRVILLISAAACCFIAPAMAWTLGDICIGSMAWINIVGILLLQKPAIRCYFDYKAQLKAGINRNDIIFNPTALGLTNTDFWADQYELAMTTED